jgi:hypothetical protein
MVGGGGSWINGGGAGWINRLQHRPNLIQVRVSDLGRFCIRRGRNEFASPLYVSITVAEKEDKWQRAPKVRPPCCRADSEKTVKPKTLTGPLFALAFASQVILNCYCRF